MRQFFIIFRFEFLGLIRTKAFIITTTIFCLVAFFGLSFPTFFGEINPPQEQSMVEQYKSNSIFVVSDPNDYISNHMDVVALYFPKAKFHFVNGEEEVRDAILKDKADAGFVVHKDYKFTYYVEDSSMTDITSTMFSETLSQIQRNQKFEAAGLDAGKIMEIYYSSSAIGETITLGSDGANNIIYTFGLIFAIYMVIVMYGQIIATSVASEKGNRTMELLVTSASTNSLIFGKVIAGAVAATMQVTLFVSTAMLTYTLLGSGWNGMLDLVFQIPVEVLSAFAAFGILGFLFYAFIFGAVGALVSKSEDVNSSATPITLIFIVVYILVYIGIMNPSSIIFTIASFIPFSSPMAMFARMALVNVPMIQVFISLAILFVSTALVGIAASKIYRRGTLMYGNQIHMIHALKWLKKDL